MLKAGLILDVTAPQMHFQNINVYEEEQAGW